MLEGYFLCSYVIASLESFMLKDVQNLWLR